MAAFRSFIAAFALMLVAALPAQAQGNSQPAVALQGMDVVSYFQPGGPVQGQLALAQDFDGARYLFASAENRAAFMADPDRYLPQFGGLCTTGLSVGIIGQGRPDLWRVVDGRLFLFSAIGHERAMGREAEVTARASDIWANNRPALPQ
jgi:YHS domain-containing protein